MSWLVQMELHFQEKPFNIIIRWEISFFFNHIQVNSPTLRTSCKFSSGASRKPPFPSPNLCERAAQIKGQWFFKNAFQSIPLWAYVTIQTKGVALGQQCSLRSKCAFLSYPLNQHSLLALQKPNRSDLSCPAHHVWYVRTKRYSSQAYSKH
jgi:hypothetical protein